jgi:branched-chain amino acid transport system permease protein
VLLGTPVLKLRGDYLAIVTLGFGEIIRVFMNNLEHPVNITNGPRGLDRIDSDDHSASASARRWRSAASASPR